MKTTVQVTVQTEKSAPTTTVQPQIATFDEWTKEKLKNEEKKKALQQVLF